MLRLFFCTFDIDNWMCKQLDCLPWNVQWRFQTESKEVLTTEQTIPTGMQTIPTGK